MAQSAAVLGKLLHSVLWSLEAIGSRYDVEKIQIDPDTMNKLGPPISLLLLAPMVGRPLYRILRPLRINVAKDAAPRKHLLELLAEKQEELEEAAEEEEIVAHTNYVDNFTDLAKAIKGVEKFNTEAPELREAYNLAAKLLGRELQLALRQDCGPKVDEVLANLIRFAIKLQKFPLPETQELYKGHVAGPQQEAEVFLRCRKADQKKKTWKLFLRYKSELPKLLVLPLLSSCTATWQFVCTSFQSQLTTFAIDFCMSEDRNASLLQNIKHLASAYLLSKLILWGLNRGLSSLQDLVEKEISTRMYADAFQHSLKLDYEFYELHGMDVIPETDFFSELILSFPQWLHAWLSFLLSAVAILKRSPTVAIGLMCMHPAKKKIARLFRDRACQIWIQEDDIESDFSMDQFRAIRLFAREDLEFKYFCSRLRKEEHSEDGWIYYVLANATEFLQRVGAVGLVFQVFRNANIPGEALQPMLNEALALDEAMEEVSDSTRIGGEVNSMLRNAAQLFDFLETKPKIGLHDGMIPETSLGNLHFDNLHFSYPTRPEDKVLQGLSFVAEQGKLTALVGPSGSGKSTVMALVERLYDPHQGSIWCGPYNLKELQPLWLRSQIAIVSQEPYLIPGSIRDNLVYGCRSEPSQEELERAAKDANIYSFIMKCKDKWRTSVENSSVSGGQKQRLAIARAILMKPQILLLDEATSALDQESERLVQEAMERLMVGRTTIAIAHRLSTICNADHIVVIKDGQVLEQGTHQGLVEQKGLYHKYCQDQFSAVFAEPASPMDPALFFKA